MLPSYSIDYEDFYIFTQTKHLSKKMKKAINSILVANSLNSVEDIIILPAPNYPIDGYLRKYCVYIVGTPEEEEYVIATIYVKQ